MARDKKSRKKGAKVQPTRSQKGAVNLRSIGQAADEVLVKHGIRSHALKRRFLIWTRDIAEFVSLMYLVIAITAFANPLRLCVCVCVCVCALITDIAESYRAFSRHLSAK